MKRDRNCPLVTYFTGKLFRAYKKEKQHISKAYEVLLTYQHPQIISEGKGK